MSTDHSVVSEAAPFVLGDWGTSHMRLFLYKDGAVIDRTSGPGIGRLQDSPAEALRAAVAPWVARFDLSELLLCGTAGSRNGLVELPYAPCPVGIVGWTAWAMRVNLDKLQVTLAPGLSCRHEGVHDVMRGEETQMFGAMAQHRELAQGRHCIVLPGTHSKWAALEDGQVTSFRTYFTGELFALLKDHSTLTRAGDDDSGRDEGFAAGLDRSGGSGALTGMLFAARSEQLLARKTRGWATGYLSGLLIGQEVREAAGLAVDGPIVMIGDPGLTALYRQALKALGLASMDIDGNASAIAGLLVLRTLTGKGQTDAH